MKPFNTLLGTHNSQTILKVVIGEGSLALAPAVATGWPGDPRSISPAGIGPAE